MSEVSETQPPGEDGDPAIKQQQQPPRSKDPRAKALRKVQRYGRVLACLSIEFRDDKEIVLAAVTNDGKALEWASRRLRHDTDVVQRALRHGSTLRFVPTALHAHKPVMLTAVQQRAVSL